MPMRWFVLLAGLFMLGGFTLAGYITMVWLTIIAETELSPVQNQLCQTAEWMLHNGAVLLGSFLFGWLAGQVR